MIPIKYNDIYAAVKAAFPSYKINPSAGSISVINKLQAISLALRSNGNVAVFSSVSGLLIDMGIWEQFESIAEAVEFALSIVLKPEDQPDVDLNSPDERSPDSTFEEEESDEIEADFIEAEIVKAPIVGVVSPDLIGLR